MSAILSLDTLGLLLLTVFPGAVSLTVYRLFMPARPLEWKDITVQGLFYSVINYALLFPLLPFVFNAANQDTNPVKYWIASAVLILIGPISWPLLLIKLFDWPWLARRVQLPYPTAWDYYFRKRQPCFVIARLKDGKALAGYWGRDSYATSFPNDGELYLQAVYRLNSDGTFGEPIADTRGALIRRDSYVVLEFFEVPSDTKAVTDVQERQPESPIN